MIKNVKTLAESTGLTSIPSSYRFASLPGDRAVSESQESIPTIDFSLLTSDDPDRRSKVVRDLGKACEDWGFFMLVNHGVPENLMEGMIEMCRRFFDLTDEEKREYVEKSVQDPIRLGTSFNASADKVLFWRDYLKLHLHPHFHSPDKPSGFREIALEYSTRVRKIQWELLRGISESLGLEPDCINRALGVEKGLQYLAANFYPPCPQPELAMGLPPHSDLGLLTILVQNGVGGLQVQHDGRWVQVNLAPNCFCVNICDQLEIVSNGKYKSVMHRAVVNNRTTRISIAMSHGPALDAIARPSPGLLVRENQSPAYLEMIYRDYFELQQSNTLKGKSCLDTLRLQTF